MDDAAIAATMDSGKTLVLDAYNRDEGAATVTIEIRGTVFEVLTYQCMMSFDTCEFTGTSAASEIGVHFRFCSIRSSNWII
jgi:hypothetical protein